MINDINAQNEGEIEHSHTHIPTRIHTPTYIYIIDTYTYIYIVIVTVSCRRIQRKKIEKKMAKIHLVNKRKKKYIHTHTITHIRTTRKCRS